MANMAKKLVILAAAIMLLGLIGRQDMDDELKAAEQYTRNVCQGTWPDYKGLKPNCTD